MVGRADDRAQFAGAAQLVSVVKTAGHMSLAIGDGGNDVAMIQAADVGVGIAGREGQQAARAADVSLGSFAHLPRLLLVHGRLAHHRTALLAQYTIHKAQALCFLQLAFNGACAVSGCSLLDTVSLTAYNLLLTSLPSALMVLDADRTPEALMACPRLYAESAAGATSSPSRNARM